MDELVRQGKHEITVLSRTVRPLQLLDAPSLASDASLSHSEPYL